MIKNLENKIEVRATSLNPRLKEGTVRTVHLSIAKIWLTKGWAIETDKEHYEPKPPNVEAVEEAKKKVRKPRTRRK